MTTLDSGKQRTVAVTLADCYCHPVTYRGKSRIRCRLCGGILASVVAHFAARHRDEYEKAGGRA